MRGPAQSPFSVGTTITTEQANFDGTGTYGGSAKGTYRQQTLQVGSFPANDFGLHDMHGNVREWVQDCYADAYNSAPSDGRAIPDVPGCSRVLRGGSWIDAPRAARSAYRGLAQPTARFIYRGFRSRRTSYLLDSLAFRHAISRGDEAFVSRYGKMAVVVGSWPFSTFGCLQDGKSRDRHVGFPVRAADGRLPVDSASAVAQMTGHAPSDLEFFRTRAFSEDQRQVNPA